MTPAPSELQAIIPAATPAPAQQPAMHMPPSLTPFFDIRGWIQDTIDKAVQPPVQEISVLKNSLQTGGSKTA